MPLSQDLNDLIADPDVDGERLPPNGQPERRRQANQGKQERHRRVVIERRAAIQSRLADNGGFVVWSCAPGVELTLGLPPLGRPSPGPVSLPAGRDRSLRVAHQVAECRRPVITDLRSVCRSSSGQCDSERV